ncbi:hypothetical protein PF006_g28763 [Phytophthora fragariae]|uniref:FYVE-type domain-containing protein n=1 Tax=Phytophthora fragariae TaxID=53985 RepID=A0A6A3QBU9_9STRA|nr:hypothetical protein PF006_g28763 [Phytophthora fragariae]
MARQHGLVCVGAPPTRRSTALAKLAAMHSSSASRVASRGVASAGKKPTANKNYNGAKNANTNANAKATKPNADMNEKEHHIVHAPRGLRLRDVQALERSALGATAFNILHDKMATCACAAATTSPSRRRHHCRACGELVCGECSPFYVRLPELGYTGRERVCTHYHALAEATLESTVSTHSLTRLESAAASSESSDNEQLGGVVEELAFRAVDVLALTSRDKRSKLQYQYFVQSEKLCNLFVDNDEATARAINANVNAKHDHVDQWVRGAVKTKVLAYVHKIQENRQHLLVLLIVSTTLTKYALLKYVQLE